MKVVHGNRTVIFSCATGENQRREANESTAVKMFVVKERNEACCCLKNGCFVMFKRASISETGKETKQR